MIKMAQHWQELIPIDRYVVFVNGLLHDYDRKVLTFLYQPLIGAKSLSLYLTLWAELEENRIWSEASTHHRLMTLMDLKLNDIYEARLKLEGIGLMTTLLRNEEKERNFIYQLEPPFTPEQFFLDDMLSIPLYRKLGPKQYQRLKQFFSHKRVDVFNGFSNVTRSFDDVYEILPPSALKINSDMSNDLTVDGGKEFIGRKSASDLELRHFSFNFELLEAGLSENLVPKSALTDKVREAISKLAYLYGIDAIQMKNIVIDATDQGVTNIDALRTCAKDWYEFHHGGLPSLVDKTQALPFKDIHNEPITKEEKQIAYFETKSPREFLRELGGGEPSRADLSLLEGIMFQQRLEPGVINVLIDFIMRTNDMKLPKAFTEKIASQWGRKQVKTVKEAMDLARKEYKDRQQWVSKKDSNKKPQSSYNKKPIRTELLPDWFHEKDSNENQAATESVQSDVVDSDFEAKKRALEEKIKNLRK